MSAKTTDWEEPRAWKTSDIVVKNDGDLRTVTIKKGGCWFGVKNGTAMDAGEFNKGLRNLRGKGLICFYASSRL